MTYSGWKKALVGLALLASLVSACGGGGSSSAPSHDPSDVAGTLPDVVKVVEAHPPEKWIVEQVAVTVRPAYSDPREADSVGTFLIVQYTDPVWADVNVNLNVGMGGYAPTPSGEPFPDSPAYKLDDSTLLLSLIDNDKSTAATVKAADHLGLDVAQPVDLQKVYGSETADHVLAEYMDEIGIVLEGASK